MNSKRIRLWDLPTRLFHWLLAVAVAAALISAEIGGNFMDWHGRIGLLIVGLLAFRLVWGVLGSTYARFAHFFPSLTRIRSYLGGEWRGEGHNPLGALSVFALLGILLFQVISGVFANDDIAFTGPLFDLVGKDWSDILSGWHHEIGELVLPLIGLHIAAILFYVHVKKQNLVKPMITGWKEGEGESAKGGGWLAFVVALAIALAAVYGASGAWLKQPQAPAGVETPKF